MDYGSNILLRQCSVNLEDCRRFKQEPRYVDPRDVSRSWLDETTDPPASSPRIKREIVYPQQLAPRTSSKLANPDEQSIKIEAVDPLQLIPYIKQEAGQGEEPSHENGELDFGLLLPLMRFEVVDPRDLMKTVKVRLLWQAT